MKTTMQNLENPAYLEAKSLSLVWDAYADNCPKEYIIEDGIGFNSYSGYVYIALENGISICSKFGKNVEYLVTNFENGEESFFEEYEEALTFLYNLNA